jgi:tight adherence protein C
MNPMILLAIVGVIVVGLAVALIFIGIRNPQSYDERELQSRLDDFNQRGETVDLEKIELSLPFTERVIYPMARKLGEVAVHFTPQNALQSVSKKLDLAGNPGNIDPILFLSLQFIAAGLFGGVIILAFTLGTSAIPLGSRLLYAIGGTVVGFYFPQLWLTSKINKRQKSVRRAMPDALDLLTVCVEAGLGFDAAMAKVSEKWDNELSLAFNRVIREIQLGKIRREAMRDMAERLGVSEMSSFVAAVIQSEQLGVSMAKILRIQSDQMRVKRRQLAEEEAHKAPIKMLIPMALLIFPSLMLTLMTPAALRIFNSPLGASFK